MSNYFTLLDLGEPQFALDAATLLRQFQQKQREFHPDRVRHLDAQGKQHALQQSLSLNQAYQTLREPLTRAIYLLELQNITLEGPNRYQPSAALLAAVFAVRERVAGGDAVLAASLAADIALAAQEFAGHYQRQEHVGAAEMLVWWRYLIKAEQELQQVLTC